MRPRRAAIGALLFVAACGADAPIPPADALLRVAVGADVAAPGEAFPVTVVRSWRKELAPSEWRDDALAPLVLHPIDVARREDGDHVEETRQCRGYAFGLRDVATAAPTFVATPKSGGAARTAVGDPVLVRVRPLLDPNTPGPAEIPDLVSIRNSWLRWTLVGAAAALVASLLALRRRRAVVAPAPAPTIAAVHPADRALRRLAEIRGTSGVDAHVAAATIVRDYVRERFDVPTSERTSEEIVASPKIAGADSLALVLSRCDAVKFAAHAPTAEDASRLVADAERFVAETRA